MKEFFNNKVISPKKNNYQNKLKHAGVTRRDQHTMAGKMKTIN